MIVVIVEDDEGMRESTQLLLETNGYKTKGYISAEALLADAEGVSACTFLVVDQNLHGMHGVALMRSLATAGSLPPTLLISARLTKMIVQEAMAAGAFDALEKPVSPDKLLSYAAQIESAAVSAR